jgi:hypothetical protein
MIIFRVTTGRSFTKFPTVKSGVLSRPIAFAHQTTESSFLESSLNRDEGRNIDSDAERGISAQTAQKSIIEISEEKGGDGDSEKNV